MIIQRKPKSTADAENAFIVGAPDAGHIPEEDVATYEKGIAKGHKRQITLTIAPDLLRKVDEMAKRTGQARAAIINMAVYQAIEGDFFKHV